MNRNMTKYVNSIVTKFRTVYMYIFTTGEAKLGKNQTKLGKNQIRRSPNLRRQIRTNSQILEIQ